MALRHWMGPVGHPVRARCLTWSWPCRQRWQRHDSPSMLGCCMEKQLRPIRGEICPMIPNQRCFSMEGEWFQSNVGLGVLHGQSMSQQVHLEVLVPLVLDNIWAFSEESSNQTFFPLYDFIASWTYSNIPLVVSQWVSSFSDGQRRRGRHLSAPGVLWLGAGSQALRLLPSVLGRLFLRPAGWKPVPWQMHPKVWSWGMPGPQGGGFQFLLFYFLFFCGFRSLRSWATQPWWLGDQPNSDQNGWNRLKQEFWW